MMAMHRLFLLAACLSAGQAAAETRTVSGQQLVFTNTLSQDVSIGTDSSLSGQIRVSLDSNLSCLSIVGGAAVVIGTTRCGEDDGHLRIDVPPDAAVTIAGNGDGNITVGDLRAPLVATLSGSGDLKLGRAGGLVLSVRGNNDVTVGDISGPASIDISGSGDVRIRSLHGSLSSKQAGSGDLVIGRIEAASASLVAAGSGNALVGAGRIGTLKAAFHGSSDLAVAATIGTADVEANGGSDIKLGEVSGTLNKSSSGGSEIIVGGSSVIDSVIGSVADKIGDAESNGSVTVTRGGTGGSGVHMGLLGFVFAALVLYIGFRLYRRPGGFRGLRQAPASAGPSNPAVLALCATMARLEKRLAGLEEYVSTREFDLERKFRDL